MTSIDRDTRANPATQNTVNGQIDAVKSPTTSFTLIIKTLINLLTGTSTRQHFFHFTTPLSETAAAPRQSPLRGARCWDRITAVSRSSNSIKSGNWAEPLLSRDASHRSALPTRRHHTLTAAANQPMKASILSRPASAADTYSPRQPRRRISSVQDRRSAANMPLTTAAPTVSRLVRCNPAILRLNSLSPPRHPDAESAPRSCLP